MVKYLVEGGWVTSKNDGDSHYISTEQLIKLYGVPKSECLMYHSQHRYTEEYLDSLIYLCPQPSGNYNLKDRNATTNTTG